MSVPVEGRRRSLTWWQVVVIAMIVMVFPGLCAVLFVCLAPVIVIAAARPRRGESAVLPALFFVLAVSLHPVHALVVAGGDWGACRAVLTNYHYVCMDCAAGALGWFLSESVVTVLRYREGVARKAEGRKLEAEIAALRDEWQIGAP